MGGRRWFEKMICFLFFLCVSNSSSALCVCCIWTLNRLCGIARGRDCPRTTRRQLEEKIFFLTPAHFSFLFSHLNPRLRAAAFPALSLNKCPLPPTRAAPTPCARRPPAPNAQTPTPPPCSACAAPWPPWCGATQPPPGAPPWALCRRRRAGTGGRGI